MYNNQMIRILSKSELHDYVAGAMKRCNEKVFTE